ncbi:Leucine--tRNA ligase [Gossypium arboreum]|uniref:Leucine--tRNA ligase n=1 Tax=Gossypium arboreum TaxID=29729 RepID=A0A0B0NDB8_GOSAR|nr:Leucine--tRNA ligase [Gossypium arboreum]
MVAEPKAEPKAEQSISNGAVKMEIDEETKEDEILTEANREKGQGEEEDMVVREIDVFFSPSIDADAQLYVLQYPLRPCWRPYELDERCKEVLYRNSVDGKHYAIQLFIGVADQIFPLNFMGLLPWQERCHMLNAMEDISLARGLVDWVTVVLLLRREAEEIQKIVVFEGAFEKKIIIMEEEGGFDGGVVVQMVHQI